MTSSDPAQRYRFNTGGQAWDGRAPALRVLRLGRFGNNLRQLLQAVHVACCIGSPRLYMDQVNLGHATSPWAFGDLRLIPFPPLASDTVVTGSFFYRNAFKRLFGKFDGKNALRVLSDVIQPMLRHRWGSITAGSDRVLHIHIRSGDTFAGRSVHPAYVPPPLSYYLSAIRIFQAKCHAPKVVLVAEDLCNPCVAHLVHALRTQHLPVSVFSEDFEHTVVELLSARHLVMSVGLFASMIALASANIRSICAFNEIVDRGTFVAKGTDMTVIHDCAGSYMRPGTWANTPAQLKQLLAYPITALRYSKPSSVQPAPKSLVNVMKQQGR